MLSSSAAAAVPSSSRLAQRRAGLRVPSPRQISGIVRGTARRPLAVRNSLTLKDEASGTQFLVAQKFWAGEEFHCLGAGTRVKKILLLNVKVYSAAAYVEGSRAAHELGIRYRGGFFETDDDYTQAVLDGAFNKVLVIHMLRDVDGQMFSEAIDKYLLPRMKLSGETAALDQFNGYFAGKKLSNNSEVVLYWNMVGDLEVLLSPPVTQPPDYSQVKPELTIRSAALCRGLFEVFLGEASVVPDAKAAWVKGAKLLLESENVKRETRRSV